MSCKILIKVFLVPILLISIPASSQQENSNGTADLRIVPIALRRSLLDRMRLFVQSQSDEDWEKVSELLGPWRRGNAELLYTKGHKRCLLEQMKRWRMVQLHPIAVNVGIEPGHGPPMNRRFYVLGEAKIAGTTEELQQLAIVAYRDDGRWYFTPPMPEGPSEIRPNTNLRNYLVVQIHKEAPLEISELSITENVRYGLRARRHLNFTIHNKSKKDVAGLSFSITRVDGNGLTSRGMPFKIKAGETVPGPDDVTYPGPFYYCEEEPLRRLTIQTVNFTDGSEWDLKNARRRRQRL